MRILLICLFIFCTIFLFADEEYQYNIEAALQLKDSKIILWNGPEYTKYDIFFKEVDPGYPKVTSVVLEDFPFPTLDAALMYKPGLVYFFKGDEFFNYNLTQNKPLFPAPEKIDNTTWPGVVFKKIDAAFKIREQSYLFSTSRYLIFDLEKKKTLPGYPKDINNNNWPGLSFTQIDAAFDYNEELIYFFYKDQFTIFDMKEFKVKSGYPQKIKDKWKNVKFKIQPPPHEQENNTGQITETQKGILFLSSDWNTIIKEAEKQKKAIMVNGYTDWNTSCQWMKTNTFSDEKTAKYYNTNFINYQLNMEKSEGINFARKYKINTYPTILYFNSQGKEIHRFTGSKEPEPFITEGKKVLNKIQTGEEILPSAVDQKENIQKMVKGKPNGTEIINPINSQFEQQVLYMVNEERKKLGLSPLSWRDDLGNSARYHAADMGIENYFDHNSYDREGNKLNYVCDTWTRIKPFASSPGAENIAAGQASPEAVLKSWMTSTGHRANILNKNLKYLGVGYFYWEKSTYGHYWVQNFGY